jgi:hypothetical protein
MSFYIVTKYGCDTTPSSMRIPKSKFFLSYNDAYKYFLDEAPDLNDIYNKTNKYVNTNIDSDIESNNEYIIIENRVQIGGYEETCAKRPYGVVIAKCNIK